MSKKKMPYNVILRLDNQERIKNHNNLMNFCKTYGIKFSTLTKYYDYFISMALEKMPHYQEMEKELKSCRNLMSKYISNEMTYREQQNFLEEQFKGLIRKDDG